MAIFCLDPDGNLVAPLPGVLLGPAAHHRGNGAGRGQGGRGGRVMGGVQPSCAGDPRGAPKGFEVSRCMAMLTRLATMYDIH